MCGSLLYTVASPRLNHRGTQRGLPGETMHPLMLTVCQAAEYPAPLPSSLLHNQARTQAAAKARQAFKAQLEMLIKCSSVLRWLDTLQSGRYEPVLRSLRLHLMGCRLSSWKHRRPELYNFIAWQIEAIIVFGKGTGVISCATWHNCGAALCLPCDEIWGVLFR